MSARARPQFELRKIPVQFSELYCFLRWVFKTLRRPLAKGPARAASYSYDQHCLSQRRGVGEDTQRLCMIERRLEGKYERVLLPVLRGWCYP